MTKEEKEAKIVEIVKLSKEMNFEVGVLIDPVDIDEPNIKGIIIGDKDFVQLTMDYIQLDSYVADMVAKRKESVPKLPEPQQKMSDTKKKSDDDGNTGGGKTWH